MPGCGSAAGRASTRRLPDRKGLVLDVLSLGFRAQAERRGARRPIRPLPAPMRFNAKANFARIFPRFLKGLPDGGLIMCHPGFVDAELESLDPLTTLREHEFAFFSSDAFPRRAGRSTASHWREPSGEGSAAA